jgi:hypothetical protein
VNCQAVRYNPVLSGKLSGEFPLSIHVLKPEIWKDIHQAVEFWGSIVVVSRLFCYIITADL